MILQEKISDIAKWKDDLRTDPARICVEVKNITILRVHQNFPEFLRVIERCFCELIHAFYSILNLGQECILPFIFPCISKKIRQITIGLAKLSRCNIDISKKIMDTLDGMPDHSEKDAIHDHESERENPDKEESSDIYRDQGKGVNNPEKNHE